MTDNQRRWMWWQDCRWTCGRQKDRLNDDIVDWWQCPLSDSVKPVSNMRWCESVAKTRHMVSDFLQWTAHKHLFLLLFLCFTSPSDLHQGSVDFQTMRLTFRRSSASGWITITFTSNSRTLARWLGHAGPQQVYWNSHAQQPRITGHQPAGLQLLNQPPTFITFLAVNHAARY